MRPHVFTCFGLVIHGFTLDGILARLEERSTSGQASMVVTANPEILLYAKQHPEYWNILRQADFRLVDGFGLQCAGWLRGARPTRVSGVEFAEGLLQLALKKNWKVGLIGGKTGNADKAAWSIRQSYPDLVVVAENGGVVNPDGSDDEAGAEARFRLVQSAPDILLVAFGHPKQEAWITRNLHEIPSVKIAVGVGGTFEYWAGEVKRAPRLFRAFGLEWLWRLLKEPRRIGRIWNAVFRFTWANLVDRG